MSDSSDPTLLLDSPFIEIHPVTSLRQCRAICHGHLPNYCQVNRLQPEMLIVKTSKIELQTLLSHSPPQPHTRQKQTQTTIVPQLDNILPILSLSDDHLHPHPVMTERPDLGLDQVGVPGHLVRL